MEADERTDEENIKSGAGNAFAGCVETINPALIGMFGSTNLSDRSGTSRFVHRVFRRSVYLVSMRLYGDAARSVLTEISILYRPFWLFFTVQK